MSEPLIVVIPAHAPTVNHYVCHTKDGKHYITAEARAWMETAGDLTAWEARSQHWIDPGGELALLIEHNNTRQDTDGCQKIVMDTVCKALGINDHRVADVHTRRAAFPGPCVRVELTALEAQP
jgi:hypothetical protein